MLENPDSEFIRFSLARSSTTPIDILNKLAADSDYTVRWNVAINAITPVNILKKLALDSNAIVRQTVAQNQRTTVKILEIFTTDKCLEVAEAARKLIAAKLNIYS